MRCRSFRRAAATYGLFPDVADLMSCRRSCAQVPPCPLVPLCVAVSALSDRAYSLVSSLLCGACTGTAGELLLGAPLVNDLRNTATPVPCTPQL